MENAQIIELAKAAKDGKIEVIYREGKAEEILAPVKPLEKKQLVLIGNSGTVLEFLRKRAHLFKPDSCNIEVITDDNQIIFQGNESQENNDFITIVKSFLTTTKDLQGLDINEDNYYAPLDLSRYLRKRKNLFTDSEEFKLVFTALSTFQAEVNRQIEKADDRTGNASNVIKQTVVSNLPKKFSLSVKPFQNVDRYITIEIEIDVNPNSLDCTLLSFDIDEKIDLLRKEIIEKELESEISEGTKLRDFCVVFYS